MKAINEEVNKADFDYPYIGFGTHFENNPLHFHGELEILYVAEGEISATVETENRILKKGDICIILPGQIHTLLQLGQIQLSVIKFFPAIPLYGARMEGFIFSEGTPGHADLRAHVEALLSEDKERRIGYSLAVKNECDALTLYILRNLLLPSEASTSPEHQAFGMRFFENANEYIEENYKKEISLDAVSASFGYSRSHFSRLFKSVCGMNFFDYLSVFRLKKSTELLKNSDLTIESVALSCGYGCLRSYNRAFGKYFGQSPGSYRRLFYSNAK